jgi:hypothetical protein
MSNTDPAFITCAMDAAEQGIKAQDIKEECACRLGHLLRKESTNNQPKE